MSDSCRKQAGNPDAVYREPMTVDDYLNARMISDPLCIYDCDAPVDGSVAVAEVYDGFTIYAVRWLEALGLTPRFETGAFLEGGHRISLDGELPISTGGGQLSAGRLHGYGAVLEACTQLRGDGGARQVPGVPEVAVVSSGAETFTSCMLLTH